MHMKPLAAFLLSSAMGAALAAAPVAESDLPSKAPTAAAPSAAPKSAAFAVPTMKPAAAAETAEKQALATQGDKSKAILDKNVPVKLEKPATAAAGAADAGKAGFMPVLEEGAVNPFTGEPLSSERRKREAERIRAENQVLEERIKQVGLLNDLNHAPVRKRVEMEQFLDQNKPKMVTVPVTKAGSAPVVETAAPVKATPAAPKKTKASKTAAKVEAPKVVEVQPMKQAVRSEPVITPPEVVGVIRTKDGSTAILSNNGKTILARPGEASSAGVVSVVSEKQVQLGSQTLEFRPSAVSRIQRTDKEAQKAEPTATVQVPSRPQVALPPIPGTGAASLPPSVRPPSLSGNGTLGGQAPTAPVAP